MSDYLDSLNASDSGFLNAFVGPVHPPHARGVASRIGSEPPFAAENSAEARADLDRLLSGAPVPAGLAERLHQLIDKL